VREIDDGKRKEKEGRKRKKKGGKWKNGLGRVGGQG
jgi:hypothetical protein